MNYWPRRKRKAHKRHLRWQWRSCGNFLPVIRWFLSTALTLEGLICFYGKPDGDEAEDVLERLYVQAAGERRCPDGKSGKGHAFFQIYGEDRSMKGRKNCWRELPEETANGKKNRLQISLYTAQERWEEAAPPTQQKLMKDINGVQSSLLSLLDIDLKLGRIDEAKQVAAVLREMTGIFDLWDYCAYLGDFGNSDSAEGRCGRNENPGKNASCHAEKMGTIQLCAVQPDPPEGKWQEYRKPADAKDT